MKPQNIKDADKTIQSVNAYIQEHEIKFVLGVDEAGRGTWAGPLVAAAVAVQPNWTPPAGLGDSKGLTRATISKLWQKYYRTTRHGIGVVHAPEVDSMGLNPAQAHAQGQAIQEALKHTPSWVLTREILVVVDGNLPPVLDKSRIGKLMLIPKADALIPAVSLASVFAKMTQLNFMTEYDDKYPQYGFGQHAGYGGSQKHRDALEQFGVCDIHRRSFGPIKKILAKAQNPERSWELLDD